MLKQLALAAFASAALLAALSPAHAGRSDCEEWGCGMNGTQLSGIADPSSSDSDRLKWFGGCEEWGCGGNGTPLNGRAVEAKQPAVSAVILPGGEILLQR